MGHKRKKKPAIWNFRLQCSFVAIKKNELVRVLTWVQIDLLGADAAEVSCAGRRGRRNIGTRTPAHTIKIRSPSWSYFAPVLNWVQCHACGKVESVWGTLERQKRETWKTTVVAVQTWSGLCSTFPKRHTPHKKSSCIWRTWWTQLVARTSTVCCSWTSWWWGWYPRVRWWCRRCVASERPGTQTLCSGPAHRPVHCAVTLRTSWWATPVTCRNESSPTASALKPYTHTDE